MHQLKEVDMLSAKWIYWWRGLKTKPLRSRNNATLRIPHDL
jgi:hypothetical protein